ncbi:MAG: MBL fold metallo-hydrolase [Acidimicrobiia bacterium]|nr:MBL fold metallo-hydrolase [Acidimicrobiia bacterium]
MERIIDGVYMVSLGYVRAWVIDGDAGVTLIDTGTPKKEGPIMAALASIGRSADDLSRIVITHSHVDHVGSLAAISAQATAEVVVPEADAAAVRGEESAPTPPMLDRVPFLKPVFRRLPGAAPASVDRTVTDGDTLPGDLTAIGTPGHTPGHTSYRLDRGDGVLFVGDACAHKGSEIVRGFFNAPRPDIDGSIRRLAEEEVGVACFAHSGVMRDVGGAFARFA